MEKANLNLKIWGIRGNAAQYTQNKGKVVAFIDNTNAYISVDAFDGMGQTYQRRDNCEIEIYDNHEFVFKGTFKELIERLKSTEKRITEEDVYGHNKFEWNPYSFDCDVTGYIFPTDDTTVLYSLEPEEGKYETVVSHNPYYLEFPPDQKFLFDTFEESKNKALEIVESLIGLNGTWPEETPTEN